MRMVQRGEWYHTSIRRSKALHERHNRAETTKSLGRFWPKALSLADMQV